LRHFFTRRQPEESRILLVESGSRYLLDALIPGILESYGAEATIDLVTCYAGLPQGLSPTRTRVYRVTDYQGNWRRLLSDLKPSRYTIVGIICAAEPIMTKWKWLVAAGLPAKVFVLNENGDYFWLDYTHWPSIRYFVLYRAGLAGAGAVRTLARLCFFPLTLLYLMMYAAFVHLRRRLRHSF
jgi:hypothetical protein